MGVRSDLHGCTREGLGPLITHVSSVLSIHAWRVLIRKGASEVVVWIVGAKYLSFNAIC